MAGNKIEDNEGMLLICDCASLSVLLAILLLSEVAALIKHGLNLMSITNAINK